MEQEESRLNRRRKRTGIVTSDKMQKTIVVRVGSKFPHPELGKVIEKFVKFKVHDEKNEAKIGDLVEIEETRSLSKDKRWRLLSVVKKGAGVPQAVEGELS
jgi:small subunit ribosomal protein S17